MSLMKASTSPNEAQGTTSLHHALCAQAGVRGLLARAEARRLRRLRAAIAIQAAVRAHQARAAFLRTRAAAMRIQAAWRGHTGRALATDLKCALPLNPEPRALRRAGSLWVEYPRFKDGGKLAWHAACRVPEREGGAS